MCAGSSAQRKPIAPTASDAAERVERSAGLSCAPFAHADWRAKMLVGVVRRRRRNSAMNRCLSAPVRYLSRIETPELRRAFHGQGSRFGRGRDREIDGSTADFLQSVARKRVILGANPGVRRQGDGFERAGGLSESKQAKTCGQQEGALAGHISALEHIRSRCRTPAPGETFVCLVQHHCIAFPFGDFKQPRARCDATAAGAYRRLHAEASPERPPHNSV